jgi:hypothetical protein
MRKALYCLLLLVCILSISSCDVFNSGSGSVYLESESFEVSKEKYDDIRNQYNMTNTRKIVIDNYDDYVSLFIKVNNKYVDASDNKVDESFFKKNVIICYSRMAKGRDIRSYCYEGSLGSIIAWAGGPIYGANSYEETDVKYYFDIVQVPNRIYKKISK